MDYMEKLNNINEDPRFQSYMSAEEDNRKMLNTYKEQAKIAEEKLEEAEAKVKEAEKNAKEAEAKAKETEKKVKEAEKNAKEKAEQSFTNGLEQGKIEAYKEMLNNGVDIALIAKSLNISVSEAKSILLK